MKRLTIIATISTAFFAAVAPASAFNNYDDYLAFRQQSDQAFYLERKRDWTGALVIWNSLANKYPDNAIWPLCNRGICKARLNHKTESLADFEAAISENPEKASTYWMRSQAEHFWHDYPAAIEDCSRAIRLSPNSDYLYEFRARNYQQIGAYDKALADDQTAFQINMRPLIRRFNELLTVTYYIQVSCRLRQLTALFYSF